jgi:hypothetical protein
MAHRFLCSRVAMKSPLLTCAQCAIALLLAFPLVLLAIYGIATFADDHDMVTLLIGSVFASLGAGIFYAAVRCVGQGRRAPGGREMPMG